MLAGVSQLRSQSETGDLEGGAPDLFPHLEIPPSTAKGWIRKGVLAVVTADEFDQGFRFNTAGYR